MQAPVGKLVGPEGEPDRGIQQQGAKDRGQAAVVAPCQRRRWCQSVTACAKALERPLESGEDPSPRSEGTQAPSLARGGGAIKALPLASGVLGSGGPKGEPRRNRGGELDRGMTARRRESRKLRRHCPDRRPMPSGRVKVWTARKPTGAVTLATAWQWWWQWRRRTHPTVMRVASCRRMRLSFRARKSAAAPREPGGRNARLRQRNKTNRTSPERVDCPPSGTRSAACRGG